jgi:UDP-GlcNAc:undecaprenyl-phosphate GlcNAc-1-phosphate transferase
MQEKKRHMMLLEASDALLASLPLALFAAVVFLVLIGPVSALMRRLGWIDRPSHRKAHAGAVPIAGGIGIVLTLLVAGLWAWVAPGSLGIDPAAFAPLAETSTLALLAGALLVFAVAFTDDRTPIRARWRFLAQGAAALVAVVGGTFIASLGELFWAVEIPLPLWIAVPFTLFGVCGVINALNMSDGADGLAGGLAFIATGWFALALAFIAGSHPQAAALLPLALALAGALAGFLLLNLRTPWRARAAIFMGDGGSMMLGFILGWLAVRSTQAFGEAGPPPVLALWILAVPLADTVSCMLRRVAHGATPMSPDHRHLHHLLPAAGLSVRRSVAIILAAALLLGGLGVLGWRLGVADWALFWTWVGLFGAYHYAALRFWATQPEDPLAPLPEHRRYPLRELKRRILRLAGAGSGQKQEPMRTLRRP